MFLKLGWSLFRGASAVFNVIKEVGTFIKKGLTVVKDIAAITNGILEFAEFAVSALDGNAEMNDKVDIDIFSVNYDRDTASSVCEISFSHVLNGQRDLPIGEIEGEVEMAGTCHDCYAYTGVSTNVHIKISNYKLMRAAVWAEGLLDFKYEFSMEFSGEGKYAANKKIFTYKIPRTTVVIAGVPCKTQGQVPIHIGAEGVLNAAVRLEGLYKIKASVKLGFEYVDTKGVQMINKMELTHEGNGIVPVLVNGHLGVQIYLWPTIELVFSNIGGPIFSIKSYLEGILDVENELEGRLINAVKKTKNKCSNKNGFALFECSSNCALVLMVFRLPFHVLQVRMRTGARATPRPISTWQQVSSDHSVQM